MLEMYYSQKAIQADQIYKQNRRRGRPLKSASLIKNGDNYESQKNYHQRL